MFVVKGISFQYVNVNVFRAQRFKLPVFLLFCQLLPHTEALYESYRDIRIPLSSLVKTSEFCFSWNLFVFTEHNSTSLSPSTSQLPTAKRTASTHSTSSIMAPSPASTSTRPPSPQLAKSSKIMTATDSFRPLASGPKFRRTTSLPTASHWPSRRTIHTAAGCKACLRPTGVLWGGFSSLLQPTSSKSFVTRCS